MCARRPLPSTSTSQYHTCPRMTAGGRGWWIIAVAVIGCGDGSTGVGDADYRVLFLGNSLTYTNDLPGMLETMGDASGLLIETCDASQPDYAIEDHWYNPGSRDAVTKGPWSVVVLQQGPSSLPESRTNLIAWSRVWADEIRRVGAAPALYMVWPDRSRLDFFSDVSLSYRLAADSTNAALYPAGEAWRAAWDQDPRLPLYSLDEFHPSVMGTYLAALTIYRGLTGRNPPSLASELGIAPADDAVLRAAAQEAAELFGRRASWGSAGTTGAQETGRIDVDSPRGSGGLGCDATGNEAPV